VAGSFKHGNELSGSLKGGEFTDWLSEYQLLKDSGPWNCLCTSPLGSYKFITARS
jgi:hypothetical protein